ncbi:hypothetical protein D3C81_1559630 [compost metagenome]
MVLHDDAHDRRAHVLRFAGAGDFADVPCGRPGIRRGAGDELYAERLHPGLRGDRSAGNHPARAGHRGDAGADHAADAAGPSAFRRIRPRQSEAHQLWRGADQCRRARTRAGSLAGGHRIHPCLRHDRGGWFGDAQPLGKPRRRRARQRLVPLGWPAAHRPAAEDCRRGRQRGAAWHGRRGADLLPVADAGLLEQTGGNRQRPA